MAKNLVIVESPAKAKTISKFLGSNYIIQASMGHVRDLPKKKLGFDPDNNFLPEYEISPDKKKTIASLKKHITKDTHVFLASDEDREGEAISWHLISALKIEKNPLSRIVFHEITKSALEHAIKNPRTIDQNLVDAQQARRILDRAVGYTLSPLLWRKIQAGLSAGRVQSTAVRILVEREREIRKFTPEEFWKIKALFQTPEFEAELTHYKKKKITLPNEKETKAHENALKNASFLVSDITEKEGKRSPAPPFTTSTLQQEASRKLGFSVKQTMMIAQQLYEGNFDIPGYSGGLITYMRTDSFNLSKEALVQAKTVIAKEFGNEYTLPSPRVFKTKSKGAQEAHEAIRPVNMEILPSFVAKHLDRNLAKLYELIWKRTIATQMPEAQVSGTTVTISAGDYDFSLKGVKILFPGFQKAYTEGSDDPDQEIADQEKILPPLKKGDQLKTPHIVSSQHFTKPPARYTEASLVKKLEAEGIGRPSTYAPTISTIQVRGYALKTEDKKLQPTDIAEIVTDFLINHFSSIVDLKFTAKMEEQFDEIASGKISWTQVLHDFYTPFINTIQEKSQISRSEVSQDRILGNDPKTGEVVKVRLGRYGPLAQIGEQTEDKKPRFASLPKGASLQDITLEEILPLFLLPKVLGTNKEGQEIKVNRGRFGPYVQIEKEFFSLKDIDIFDITLEQALQIIEEGREKKAKRVVHQYDGIEVLRGPYGIFIKANKKNYKIPKDIDEADLTEEKCKEIIASTPETKSKKRFFKKKA
jgi:DNA topoisomerase-1